MGTLDNGTVALALSGMAFYWMMPMLMGRAKRRKTRRAATNPTSPANPTTPPGPAA
jgi:hypothetical protein